MKSILYVGATLMIGASIYGFVDYRQTSQKKEFTDMYVEEKKTEPVASITEEKKEVPVVAKTEVVTKNRKIAVTKKQAIQKEEEEVVAIEPIAEDEVLVAEDPKKIEETAIAIRPSEENTIVKKSKKKKFSTKLFSRAPLRDIEEEEMPTKKEKKKQ